MIFKSSNKSTLPKTSIAEQDKYNQSFRNDVIDDLNALADLDNLMVGHVIYISKKKKVSGDWVDRSFYHTDDSGYSNKNDQDWFDDYTYPGWYQMSKTNQMAGRVPIGWDLPEVANFFPIMKCYKKGDAR